mgnify:CR=1 FL=1|tara:strand:+ start:2821 stop:3639 length:819 start_codon:yes stop_codon:yes gene_type:complete
MKNKISLTPLVIMIVLFFSCSKDDDRDEVLTSNMYLSFYHSVGGEVLETYPFGCIDGGDCCDDHACCMGGLNYTNPAGEQYNIETLKYIISNLVLHSNDGTEKLLKEVHFIDVQDPLTLRIDLGELENGNYNKLTFTMGLDSNLNIANRYVNEPWHLAMGWPMNWGYHYMKLEGAFDTIINGYLTHTGPTDGMDMSFSNESVDLWINVDDNTGDINSTLMMEINNWYQYPNDISFASYGPPGNNGIMGNMMMQHKLQENGQADVFSFTVSIQ